MTLFQCSQETPWAIHVNPIGFTCLFVLVLLKVSIVVFECNLPI
ncbi:hypothetical protein HanPSC8_Chr09g0360701 [Helianthus annuus]|nr:hypothetical protein HanPSC8_Chr09g0360701 [Helianthus annuus]